MADPTPATSPTGTPLVPPKVFAILAAIYAALAGLDGALALTLGTDHKATVILFCALATIGPLLGISSPGLRKAAPLFLLCLLPTLTGCTTLHRIGDTAVIAAPKLVDCASSTCQQELPALFATAAIALNESIKGDKFDIEGAVDKLLKDSASKFMPCAIVQVLQAWEQAGPGAGYPAPESPYERLKLTAAAHRGQAKLAERGYLFH